MNLSAIDIGIVILYAVTLFGLAQWVSREKEGHEKNSTDYFLASKALPWWAIGASLIASNISAEQFIGMAGSGYVIGLGIASYEWMSAVTLLIVAKYFMPVFLKHQIYTMPQFLYQRFGHSTRLTLAIFWLGVYIFVNLTSVLWLGAIAIQTVTGVDVAIALYVLGIFAVVYSFYGGLKAVALTDALQVFLLVAGGLALTYIALDRISGGAGPIAGFEMLMTQHPEKFDLILSSDNPNYKHLPGLAVLIGGMWIMNLSYWGFNQYIIQRALAAKNVREAQKGIVFAAFLKLLMPLIVVVPGIAAVVLAPQLAKPDQAYPTLMTLLPEGILGLVFAGLLAAIISSLGSMTNSISTIFTIDLYKPILRNSSEEHLVAVGRGVAVLSMAIALVTAEPLLGSFDQAFQYIQEFTGFFTPGIVAIFLLGMFVKEAGAASALVAAIGSAALSFYFKVYMPELPFMDRVGFVFLLCMGAGVGISFLLPRSRMPAIDLGEIDFKTSTGFNVASVAIVAILCALYATWW